REPARAAALERIEANARGLTDLTDQLLELARLDLGRTPRRAVSFDAVALAEEVVLLLQPSSGAPVTKVTASEPRLVAHADPGHARRILDNLVSNALRQLRRFGDAAAFAEAAREPIHSAVTIAVRRGLGPVLEVDVIDDGPGIPIEQRARL